VAARGDVLVLKRRLGFGQGGKPERFLVVQADSLNEALETTLVVPLDAAFSYCASYPGAVRIPAREAGAPRDQVAVITALASVDLSRFEDAPTTQVGPVTLARVDRMLSVALDLAD
jgi:mRNA-degrading endonuclease toxin of MazEF toxin-antitoxin module